MSMCEAIRFWVAQYVAEFGIVLCFILFFAIVYLVAAGWSRLTRARRRSPAISGEDD